MFLNVHCALAYKSACSEEHSQRCVLMDVKRSPKNILFAIKMHLPLISTDMENTRIFIAASWRMFAVADFLAGL